MHAVQTNIAVFKFKFAKICGLEFIIGIFNDV